MPPRRGSRGPRLAAALLAGCAADPKPPPVTISIPEAPPAPPPAPAPPATDAPVRRTELRSLDDTQWTLECPTVQCEIDFFDLHVDGTATYYYHDGNVFPDALWRYEGGLLTISVNKGYATYRARRSADGFAEGRFENKVDFKFQFTLTRRYGSVEKRKKR